jgi:hypothetical protein
MSDRVEEQAYRWQRRSIFAITLAVVIALLVLCVLLV